jgi:hypothetical protein
MTLHELMDRVLAVFPDAMFDESDEREVVIYTGMLRHPDDNWNTGSRPVEPLTEN